MDYLFEMEVLPEKDPCTKLFSSNKEKDMEVEDITKNIFPHFHLRKLKLCNFVTANFRTRTLLASRLGLTVNKRRPLFIQNFS